MANSPSDPIFLPGKLSWIDAKDMAIHVRVDRIAVHGDKLMLLSCVANVPSIKSLRAALATVFDKPMSVNIKLTGPDLTYDEPPNRFSAAKGGYSYVGHKLCYDQAHAIFVSRTRGLLMEENDDALWRELKSDRFSTPLLRSWLPYIKEQLVDKKLIKACHCCNCRPMMLVATTADLDAIVEDGIKTSHLLIREDAA